MPTMYCIVTIKLEKDNVMKKTLRKHIYWIYWGEKIHTEVDPCSSAVLRTEWKWKHNIWELWDAPEQHLRGNQMVVLEKKEGLK